MQKISNHIINGSKGKPIALDIVYTGTGREKPVVLFCHGFKGFKNWGHYDLVAEDFARNGFIFVKFNFSCNGTTPEHPVDFADLDAFGKNNFTIELDDLGLVIDFIEAHIASFSGNPDKIFLIGHSRGGGISILKTKEDKRVKKLVTWASVKDAEDFFTGQNMEQWKNEGVVYTYNSRTHQNMPLNYQLYENYLQNKNRLNIPEAAQQLSVPWMILHGTNDNSVPVFAGEQLHAWNPKSELLLIGEGDHTFGGKHPWNETNLPPDAKFAVEKTMDFFRNK